MSANSLNADSQELDKFSTWGADWWNPTGESLMLHKVNPHRLGFVDEIAQVKGKTTLDVGCGGGILAESLTARGANATGIDLADGALQAAQAYSRSIRSGTRYLKIPVEELAEQEAGRYDVVTCMEMLEHVPDPGSIVRSIGKLVKPGGHIFISTLNRSPLGYLLGIVALEYVLRLVPVGTHDWRKFLTPDELEKLCNAAGLEVRNRRGIRYNPITETFALIPQTRVNYILHCQRAR